ncbi:MAG: nucleotidyltransferase family protein [Cyanophyceae cyanobacterium]
MTDQISQFSPEMRLLILAARTQITDTTATELQHLAQQSLNWTRFIQLAHDHGVLPLVSHTLYRCQPQGLPVDMQNLLQEKTQDRICRNLYLAQELVRVVRLLQDSGIPCIPFKGPSLAQLAYGNLALRRFLDLDILIPRELSLKAIKILGGEGYLTQLTLTPEQENDYLDSHIGFDLHNPEKRVSLELHWNLMSPVLSFPAQVEDLWSDPLEINLLGTQIHTISLNLLLIYLCFHANKHRWEQLKWICDIAELLGQTPEINWDHQIECQAVKLGSLRILLLGLSLANRLLDAPLPLHFQQQVEQDRQVLLLTQQVLRRIGDTSSHPPTRWQDHWFYLQSREQWQDRWPYCEHVGRLLILPSSTDRNWFPLPKPLDPLYFLVRPVRVFVQRLSNPKTS